VPRDSGPREYAIGEVQYDESGTPSFYIVGSGDLIEFVAERLGLHSAYLVTINQVRRGTTGVLWEGDVLNLNPQTITSVGTINGSVLSEAPPDPMPPQH
jgi:hypothetical protein